MSDAMLKCSGCNKAEYFAEKKVVNSCKHRGEGDCNHILEYDPLNANNSIDIKFDEKVSPYIIFKDFFYSYKIAQTIGVNFDDVVLEINKKLNLIDEPEFKVTPIKIIKNYGEGDGKLIIKNETINVSGSHKARHIMGNVLYFEVLRHAGVLKEKPSLAIYSCGNAALGAAAVAKAAGYKLSVFIPVGVNQNIIRRLKFHGSSIIECPRVHGETGDPCYNRFQEALKNGAVPCSCSGPDNWSNIEGGQTLALELVSQIREKNLKLNSLTVQVGGGALASAAFKSIQEYYELNKIDNYPKLFAVQTEGGYPLLRAFLLLQREIARKNNLRYTLDFVKKTDIESTTIENKKLIAFYNEAMDQIMAVSNFIKHNYSSDLVQSVLKNASEYVMSKFMWCWESEPHSVAHGILDDITFDWFRIITGVFMSGGLVVTVSENELKIANSEAKNISKIKVDHTGSSGFAGFLKLLKIGALSTAENNVVIFTGVER